MNSKSLISFITAAEEGSFSKAALKLYLSVPAIKEQIDSLEEELQFKLFFRTNQGIKLTEEGVKFLSFSKDVLLSFDNEIQKLKRISEKKAKTINIGHNTVHIFDPLYYDAVSLFKKKNSNIDIHLTEAEFFSTEKYDLFLGTVKNRTKFINTNLLCRLPVQCLIPKSSPLSGKKSVTVSDLSSLDLLLPPQNLIAEVSDLIDQLLAHHIAITFLSNFQNKHQYLQRAIVYQQCSLIIGHETQLHNSVCQLPLEGYFFDYYIYSDALEEKPAVIAYVSSLQNYYKIHHPF